MTDLCRLCFRKHDLIWVFDSKFKYDLTKVIENASGVKIEKTDLVSQMICDTCLSINHRINKYRTTSIQNDNTLKWRHQQSGNFHFSIREIMTKNPHLKIPEECLQLHLGAYITLEPNEVDDWFKERNVSEEDIKKLKRKACETSSEKKKKKRKRHEEDAVSVRSKLYRTTFSGPQKLRFKRITTEEMDDDSDVRDKRTKLTLESVCKDSVIVKNEVREDLNAPNASITPLVGVRRPSEDLNAPIICLAAGNSEVRRVRGDLTTSISSSAAVSSDVRTASADLNSPIRSAVVFNSVRSTSENLNAQISCSPVVSNKVGGFKSGSAGSNEVRGVGEDVNILPNNCSNGVRSAREYVSRSVSVSSEIKRSRGDLNASTMSRSDGVSREVRKTFTSAAGVGSKVRRVSENLNVLPISGTNGVGTTRENSTVPFSRSSGVSSENRSARESLDVINVKNGSSKVLTASDNNGSKNEHVSSEESLLEYLNISLFSNMSDKETTKVPPLYGVCSEVRTSREILDIINVDNGCGKVPSTTNNNGTNSEYVPLEKSLLDYLNTSSSSSPFRDVFDGKCMKVGSELESGKIPDAKLTAREEKLTEETNTPEQTVTSKKTETVKESLKNNDSQITFEEAVGSLEEQESSDSDEEFYTSRALGVSNYSLTLTMTPKKEPVVISSDSEKDIGTPEKITNPQLPDFTNSPNMDLLSVKSKQYSVYTCEICDALLKTAKERKRHVRKTHMKCPLCNKRFRNLTMRDEHQNSCPKKILENSDGEKNNSPTNS